MLLFALGCIAASKCESMKRELAKQVLVVVNLDLEAGIAVCFGFFLRRGQWIVECIWRVLSCA